MGGVAASGSPISRWTTSTPAASSARALASTSNADSVPSLCMRSASSMTGYGKPMRDHEVRVQRPGERFPRERELAWRLAEVAADPVPVEPEVAEMAANRVLDDVAVAVAALDRDPPAAAQAQALAHPGGRGDPARPRPGTRVAAEWAAWANGTAVRELDFHDTFLAADFAHPGDNIPPLLAVAQQCRRSGADLVRAIVTAYEVQVALTTRSTCTATRSTTSPTWARASPPGSAPCSGCRSRSPTRRSTRPCT